MPAVGTVLADDQAGRPLTTLNICPEDPIPSLDAVLAAEPYQRSPRESPVNPVPPPVTGIVGRSEVPIVPETRFFDPSVLRNCEAASPVRFRPLSVGERVHAGTPPDTPSTPEPIGKGDIAPAADPTHRSPFATERGSV